MKKKFVIKQSNLYTRLPIHGTILILISLDHWNAPDVVRGVLYTLMAIGWFFVLKTRFEQEEVDLFDFENEIDDQIQEPTTSNVKAKSKFQMRLEKIAKDRGIDLTKKTKIKSLS